MFCFKYTFLPREIYLLRYFQFLVLHCRNLLRFFQNEKSIYFKNGSGCYCVARRASGLRDHHEKLDERKEKRGGGWGGGLLRWKMKDIAGVRKVKKVPGEDGKRINEVRSQNRPAVRASLPTIGELE